MVPLWIFDEKYGFGVNVDNINFMRVVEVKSADGKERKFGINIIFSDGVETSIPGYRYDTKKEAAKALVDLVQKLVVYAKSNSISVIASGVLAGLKSLNDDPDKEKDASIKKKIINPTKAKNTPTKKKFINLDSDIEEDTQSVKYEVPAADDPGPQ